MPRRESAIERHAVPLPDGIPAPGFIRFHPHDFAAVVGLGQLRHRFAQTFDDVFDVVGDGRAGVGLQFGDDDDDLAGGIAPGFHAISSRESVPALDGNDDHVHPFVFSRGYWAAILSTARLKQSMASFRASSIVSNGPFHSTSVGTMSPS